MVKIEPKLYHIDLVFINTSMKVFINTFLHFRNIC